MSKATHEQLLDLQAAVTQGLFDLMRSENPKIRWRARSEAIKFLRNNRIKADLHQNEGLSELGEQVGLTTVPPTKDKSKYETRPAAFPGMEPLSDGDDLN